MTHFDATSTYPQLMTDRLLLRAFQESDFAIAHSYAVIPEVSQYMDWGPNTEEQTREFLDKCIQASELPMRTDFHFAITLRETGRMFGGCDLIITDPDRKKAWVGYTLHPGFWGSGYATEAAQALLRFGFETLGLHRISATCHPGNVGSWNVMEKLGMRREAHEVQAVWYKGRWNDRFWYAILFDEWQG